MKEINYEFGNFDEILSNALCGNCRHISRCPPDWRCPKFKRIVKCLEDMDDDDTY